MRTMLRRACWTGLLVGCLLALLQPAAFAYGEGSYRAPTEPYQWSPPTPSADAPWYEWANLHLWLMNEWLGAAQDVLWDRAPEEGAAPAWGDWSGVSSAAEYVQRVLREKEQLIDRLPVPYTAEGVADDATLNGVPLKRMIELLKEVDETLESAGFVVDREPGTGLATVSLPSALTTETVTGIDQALSAAKRSKEALETFIQENLVPAEEAPEEEAPPAEGSAP